MFDFIKSLLGLSSGAGKRTGQFSSMNAGPSVTIEPPRNPPPNVQPRGEVSRGHSECPTCQFQFAKFPGPKQQCPECGEQLHVRTVDGVKTILNSEGFATWQEVQTLRREESARKQASAQKNKPTGDFRLEDIGTADGSCPNCGHLPEKPPKRKSKCKECGKSIRVRKRKNQIGPRLYTELQWMFFDQLYSGELFPRFSFPKGGVEPWSRDYYRQVEEYAELRFEKLRRELGRASLADLMWRAANDNIMSAIGEGRWNQYSGIRRSMAYQLVAEGRQAEAVDMALQAWCASVYAALELKTRSFCDEPALPVEVAKAELLTDAFHPDKYAAGLIFSLRDELKISADDFDEKMHSACRGVPPGMDGFGPAFCKELLLAKG